jgi:diketogulonate reductase-like aldo/keto reductase
MKTVQLPDGDRVPALGQGTWRMGEDKSARADEVAALRLGIDLGMTLIDTAEMYGDGEAEKVVADAIDGQRDRVFVVTKVYPHNASRTELPKACERSLKRLRIEVIDLYLLHWRGNVPLAETIHSFEKLRDLGKIRRWGVSNFDLDDMKELNDEILGTNDKKKRSACSANQVLYNLQHREIEFELLPWSQKNKIPIMAYSPVGHGRGLLKNAALKKMAKRHDATSAQIALAWILRARGPVAATTRTRPTANVIAIPKASNEKHVRENARSAEIKLTKEDLAKIDRAFPPPRSERPLPML